MVLILWIDGMRNTLTRWFSGGKLFRLLKTGLTSADRRDESTAHVAKCTVFDLKGGVDPTLQLWGFQALEPCSPASLCVMGLNA